ncbi:ATP-binding protein [Anaerotignum lactatifermentans]|uniref:ATP-binding protein n=1 Tax=Anaerotignum lactatifermentans TaxID=160404 RepID=A0ABS2GA23_9FIRM|nr:ATP-binding protein [Anaerotignum lactatifermentans]MBM6829293.1 ATP-binding protein [Anaerotignum lactatifermentans]MBM6877467.1 ATP-binding protein [Anaerotignum lactatifermentans]MBM6950871.1 ATP-binding protein [Anaerotignum lactatifermentans]
MRLAVLSGKGGTGKTFVSVNLAAAAKKAVYIDCDVEEPNGRLFFRPQQVSSAEVHTLLPVFDGSKCDGCKKCVEFCRFHALVYIKEKPMIFPDVCHSCGGCALVCPQQAVSEEKRSVGVIETGASENVAVVTGILNMGEASAVPVIREALRKGYENEDLTVIDCPPGSSCSVMESVSAADYAVFVAEPTAFGFHNFQMVYELVRLLKKPCGVILNKADGPYPPLEDFCKKENIPLLHVFPFSEELAALGAEGKIAVRENETLKQTFQNILKKIGGEDSL